MLVKEPRPIRGLFVGLTTLDLIYHAPAAPQSNEKVVANAMTFAAGGPATNAAIAFAALGGEATLMSVVGQHPLAQWIHHDLVQHQVSHVELMPDRIEPPTVSSIVVSTDTGDRAIISKNSQNYQLSAASMIPLSDDDLRGFDVILFDGHQMALSQAIAEQAVEFGIATIFDGGSWKLGSELLLPKLTYILCSGAFYPPGCGNESQVLEYLFRLNAQANLAITHGADPVLIVTPTDRTDCPCPLTQALDTLGAGDFFHGAFAWYITQRRFSSAIQAASAIASLSCQFLGTREWLAKIPRIL